MKSSIYDPLQLREIFHLEFLRWLGRKLRSGDYALKGGANLRFYFRSMRYSEDMDLDVRRIKVDDFRTLVMDILTAPSFQKNLLPYGIVGLIPPDIKKAKQTETSQRFKVHLLTSSGLDLFTKVECFRRGFKGEVVVETVSVDILKEYKLPPLLIPHYDITSTIAQKIEALATRSIIQPRDIFDLYILLPQTYSDNCIGIRNLKMKVVSENILRVDFTQFRDTVISYLSAEEQDVYNSPAIWDEVRLKVIEFIERLK